MESSKNCRYEKLTHENFNKFTLDYFIRHQEVKECWRKVEGEWRLIGNEFTENWSLEECREIAGDITKNLDGSQLGFGAFKGKELLGYITLGNEFFGTDNQYMEVVAFQVSEPYRNQGIGRKLFQCACEAAKGMEAKKLYISAHSSKESQAAYHKLGCRLAEEVNPVNVENEPYDVQMEYVL